MSHEPLSDERYEQASCREWLRAECKSLAAEVRRLRAALESAQSNECRCWGQPPTYGLDTPDNVSE